MESIPVLQGFDGPSVLSLQSIPSGPNVFGPEMQNFEEFLRDNDLRRISMPWKECSARLPQPKAISSPAEGDWATIAKVAYGQGDPAITADHLEAVDELTMGHEDAARVAEMVAESSGMKRVV